MVLKMKLPDLTVGVSSPWLRRERNPSEAKTLRLPAPIVSEGFSRRGIKELLARLSSRLVTIEAYILLTFVYLTVVPLVWLLKKKKKSVSGWQAWQHDVETLEDLRKQF